MASRLISFRKVQSSSNRIIFGAVAATAAGFVSSNLSMNSKTKESTTQKKRYVNSMGQMENQRM